MRIICGLSEGRLLDVPDGFHVRPIPGKVKLAVFNSLGARPIDAQVLDLLFAGSGKANGIRSIHLTFCPRALSQSHASQGGPGPASRTSGCLAPPPRN